MKLILLRGYPGSGKSTLGRRLQHEGCGIFIDHNELLKRIVAMTGNTEGIYDDIVQLELAMVRKLLAAGSDVIVGRGFATVDGVADYLAIAEEAGASHIVFRLEAPKELLAQRVLSPTRRDEYTPISTPEQLDEWIIAHPMEEVEGEVVVEVANPFDQNLQEILQTVGEPAGGQTPTGVEA